MKRDEELESIIDRLKLELGQQKHEIEALKQSAHSLHTLAVISADWFWEQDADYRFVDYSIQPGAKTQA